MTNYNRFYKELGKLIKELRIKKGLYQKELAGKMNISDMTISRWELGVTRPSDKKLRKLCEILDIDFDEFIYQINERTAQSKENDIHNLIINDIIRVPLYNDVPYEKLFTNDGLVGFISIPSYSLNPNAKYFAFTCRNNMPGFNIGDVMIFEQTNKFKENDTIWTYIKKQPYVIPAFLCDTIKCECLGVLKRCIKDYFNN